MIHIQPIVTHQLLDSNMEWDAELERAIPQLLIHVQDSSKPTSWRKQLQMLEKEMNTLTTEEEFCIQWIQSVKKETEDVSSMIQAVENALENQYPDEIDKLRKSHEELHKLKASEEESVSRIANLSRKLEQLTIDLDYTKRAVEEKGRSITDTSVLVERKSSLQRLKVDVREYDVQIGLLDHFCLQKRVFDAKRKLESSLPDDSFLD